MTGKRKVIQNSILYTFSAILFKAVGFLLLPIYTFYLSTEEYGTINLITSFLGIATYITSLSLFSAAIRFYVDYKNDKEKLRRFYSSIINFVFLSSTFSFIVIYIFRNEISTLLFKGIDFYPIVFIGTLSLVFVSLHQLHTSILQGKQQGKKLTIVNLIVVFISISLKLVFIIVLDMGATGFLLSELIVNFLYFFYLFYDMIHQKLYLVLIDFTLLAESIKYSVPIIIHNTSTHIASFFSKIFLNEKTSLSSVGIYSIGFQISAIIDIIQSSVNKAFQPWVFAQMDNIEIHKKQIVSFSSVLLIIYSIIYMIIGLFCQEVVLLMTSSTYNSAWLVIPILVVGYSVKSIYYFFLNIILYSKKASRKLFMATLIGSLFNILFAFLLIPSIGVFGSAIAFVLAKITVVTIVVILSKRDLDIGYKVTKMLSIIIPSLSFMSIGLIFSYTKFQDSINFYNLIYKVFIMLAYLGFIYIGNKRIIKTYLKSDSFSNLVLKMKQLFIKNK